MTNQGIAQWTVPALIVDPMLRDAASAVLHAYFEESQGSPTFTGAQFERFDGGGDRSEVVNQITMADLVALSLLDTPVSGGAALGLLGPLESEISSLLERVPADLDLGQIQHRAEYTEVMQPMNELWSRISGQPGMGRTRTSKLLARKRPRLQPVIDSVVSEALGHKGSNFRLTLWSQLRTEGLEEQLASARSGAGIDADIALLRCFDVLMWLPNSNSRAARNVMTKLGHQYPALNQRPGVIDL
ncbi:DUF6308 family protein [Gordonia iterans]